MLYLSLGSNIGNRAANITQAYSYIEKFIGPISCKSSLWESEPWGYASEYSFFNTVCFIPHHSSDIEELLQLIRMIEMNMGRVRKQNHYYEDRCIDIDIIAMDNVIIEREDLCIPHPKMHLRKFVLYPLKEISPEWVHPRLKVNISTLINQCPDNTTIRIVSDYPL